MRDAEGVAPPEGPTRIGRSEAAPSASPHEMAEIASFPPEEVVALCPVGRSPRDRLPWRCGERAAIVAVSAGITGAPHSATTPRRGAKWRLSPHAQRPARPGKPSLSPCASVLLFSLRCRDLPGSILFAVAPPPRSFAARLWRTTQDDIRRKGFASAHEMGIVLNISVWLPCLFASPTEENAGSAEGMFVRERS